MGAGGAQVFLYAGSETATREAERIAREVLAGHHFQAELAIDRWHPAQSRRGRTRTFSCPGPPPSAGPSTSG